MIFGSKLRENVDTRSVVTSPVKQDTMDSALVHLFVKSSVTLLKKARFVKLSGLVFYSAATSAFLILPLFLLIRLFATSRICCVLR